MVAVVLIASSFLSAYALSALANRTQLMWGVRTALVEGSKVSYSNLVARRVALPDGDAAYISAEHDISNFMVVKSVEAGELIPASAITQNADARLMSAVPISIHSADVPLALLPGEPINIYHVGDPHLSQEVGAPTLVLAHAFILGIDRNTQNMGGDLTLTISASIKNVIRILAATATGRLVVVRVNG